MLGEMCRNFADEELAPLTRTHPWHHHTSCPFVLFTIKGSQGQQQRVGVRVPTHQEVRVRWCGGDRVCQVPFLEEGGRDPARLAVQAAGCVRGTCSRAAAVFMQPNLYGAAVSSCNVRYVGVISTEDTCSIAPTFVVAYRTTHGKMDVYLPPVGSFDFLSPCPALALLSVCMTRNNDCCPRKCGI